MRPKQKKHSRKPRPTKADRAVRPSEPKAQASPHAPARYYPVSLDIIGKLCLVAGGGKVAERKVRGLLEAGGAVKVVSPTLTAWLSRAASSGKITQAARNFRATDLSGAFLAIAATDSDTVNARIAALAKDRGVLVNAVDQPRECGFIVPATLRRGPLSVSVTTSGTSPAMARAIRRELEALYGPAFGRYLKKLRTLRLGLIAEHDDPAEREARLRALAGQDVIDALRAEGSGKTSAKPRARKKR